MRLLLQVLPFVRLFHGNGLNTVVLTDFDRGQKKKLEGLYKAELLDSERIILATEVAGKEEADIEDFFSPAFFVALVNATYGLIGEHTLTVEKLHEADTATVRQVKKAEAYFRTLPPNAPQFGHFDPAMHLLKNPVLLDQTGDALEQTLASFEEAFKRIEKFAGMGVVEEI